MSISIRQAGPADAPRLTELIVELGHPIEEAQVRRNLESLAITGMLPLVASDGDQLIGMCGLSTTLTVHRDAPVGRITAMIVTQACRGRGVGALLIAEAEVRLVARGCRIIEVTSNERRDGAHRFYEQLGYERTSYRFMKRIA